MAWPHIGWHWRTMSQRNPGFALRAFRSPASLETTGPMLADKHGLSTFIAPGGGQTGGCGLLRRKRFCRSVLHTCNLARPTGDSHSSEEGWGRTNPSTNNHECCCTCSEDINAMLNTIFLWHGYRYKCSPKSFLFATVHPRL